jgi:hypothetical protein
MSVLGKIRKFIGNPLNSVYGPQNYLATMAPIALSLVSGVRGRANARTLQSTIPHVLPTRGDNTRHLSYQLNPVDRECIYPWQRRGITPGQ